jgi:Na+-transporting methylmalonyl-CoA/oxaloacetate decarboxylase gamma subunit
MATFQCKGFVMDMWTITIIGVGTVFVALIGLSLVLVLFRVVFAPKPVAEAVQSPAPAVQAPAASAGIDGGVVAAIVAAIAAASGQAASDFRIASIEPVGFSTPAWGHIDRLARGPRGV